MADAPPALAEPQPVGSDPHSLADLYEHDVLAWSELQAAALRARQTGPALDWDNLAEEIEDVGKSQYQGCQSYVELIIEHLLKLEFVRSPRDFPHWRGEVLTFRDNLEQRLTRTILNRVRTNLDVPHARVIRRLLVRELPGFDREMAAFARLRPYTWEQIIDPDWWPETETTTP